ncbi:MAG: META domain-containing protein [Treponema sp.]|nr:META domain-containing protein [Treponema sp.]MCL2272734.1 META domain-containing protein [Treponema sp.]
MKYLLFAIVSIAVMLTGCAGTPSASGSTAAPVKAPAPDFSGAKGKEWKLIEVRINNTNTGYNRSSLAQTDAFTLNFHEENISGTGAPNRYSAPFTLGEGNDITIMMVRATLMAAFLEPDRLKEHDFFGYIQNVYKWNLVNNNLELNSRTNNGAEILLLFSL